MQNTLLAIVLAYLIGSIPFAVVVSWFMRLPDPRTYGSSNPGATNVLRSGNKIAALLTLFGDAAKGWFAVYLFKQYGPQFALDVLVVAPVALFVFLGHVFPVWLKFKGGKGVATALGVLLGLNTWLALAIVTVWLVVVILSRYSSLGALVASAFAPFATWYWFNWGPVTMAVIAISLILVWRHHANIGKLMRGEESRIGEKKVAPAGEVMVNPDLAPPK
jgi:acyl phosphate:glycerol-3-phosphate acyltransferase